MDVRSHRIDLTIEKPVFDTLTPIGACRPDFILELRSRNRRDQVDHRGSHGIN
jgi:hypothetical protein